MIIIPTIYARPDLLVRCLATAGSAVVVSGGSFAENCNRGADTTADDFYVFLNDDTEVPPDLLHHLYAPFSDPKVGIVGCRLVYPDGRTQHAGVYLDTPGGVLTAYNHTTDQPSGAVQAVTGACMAVRADTFWQLDGFDPTFVNGYEDVDLCLRARKAGWQVRYTDAVTVVHHESQSGPARWTHVRHNIERLQEMWRADHYLI